MTTAEQRLVHASRALGNAVALVVEAADHMTDAGKAEGRHALTPTQRGDAARVRRALARALRELVPARMLLDAHGSGETAPTSTYAAGVAARALLAAQDRTDGGGEG